MSDSASIVEADFAGYPPEAKHLANATLALLRRLPPFFAAILLRELMDYDWQFPAEQTQVTAELQMLAASWSPELTEIMKRFAALPSPEQLRGVSPAIDPAAYIEKVTAFLWLSGSIEEFRGVAAQYGQMLPVARPPTSARLAMVLLGRGTTAPQQQGLFSKLRQHGVLFHEVDTTACVQQARAALEVRASGAPARYAHWYLEGDQPEVVPSSQVTTVSYGGTAKLRGALMDRVHTARVSGTVGPEDLRSLLAHLESEPLVIKDAAADPVLARFELRLLTEGSGTQIYSTTFVQWASREVLRRAQPVTLLARYAPRQEERAMNELLQVSSAAPQLDAEGSIRDADMGAWYTWLNLGRLPGAEQSHFVAIVEGGRSAIAIGPGMAGGTQSVQKCDLAQILSWMA